MSRSAHTYIALVAAAAVGLLLALPPASTPFGAADVLGCVSFVAIGVLSEAMAIDFRLGQGRQAKSSLAFLPFLSAIVLFEPIVSVVIVVLVIGLSQFVLRKNDITRGIFNISQSAISSGLAAVAYALFISSETRSHINWLGFATVATVFFSTNVILNSIAISIIRSDPLRLVLSQVAGAKGANLWYDLLASPIALVPVGLYKDYNVGGLLIIVLPLLLIRYSYLSKVQLEEANKDLLKALVKAIETRDPYTSGHSMRVGTLARMIAESLDLKPKQIECTETAALLHDIGKIDSVYESVIRKPHDLSAAERDLIRTHATKGADLLQSLSSVNADIVRAVRHHHERFDGTGYPDGLSGETIPIAARIIMICDSIDAMLSDRPYRKALSVDKTRLELVRCAGTQFDPQIIQAILRSNTLERAAELIPAVNRTAKVVALPQAG